HILGIGLLLGGILPLDLRLLGLLKKPPIEILAPFLTRSAALGLAFAVATGLWLLSVKPAEYLANAAFRWKLVLLAIALINVAIQHRLTNTRDWNVVPTTRICAALSLCAWLSVLVAGRW